MFAGAISKFLCLMTLCLAVVGSGCSIKRMAVNKLGDALAGGGTTFASDGDPELVRAALPFSLKLMTRSCGFADELGLASDTVMAAVCVPGIFKMEVVKDSTQVWESPLASGPGGEVGSTAAVTQLTPGATVTLQVRPPPPWLVIVKL